MHGFGIKIDARIVIFGWMEIVDDLGDFLAVEQLDVTDPESGVVPESGQQGERASDGLAGREETGGGWMRSEK